MKWISTGYNTYKFVPDDDSRPAVSLPDRPGSPNFHLAPPWAIHEAAAHGDTAEEQIRGTDAFLEERAKEVAVSPKWARYEKSRKEALAKDKPAFLKSRKRAS